MSSAVPFDPLPSELAEDEAHPMEQLFTILSTPRRRLEIEILDSVVGVGNTTRTPELADWLSEYEYGEHFNSKQRKRHYISLYQTDLPRFADAGVIEYQNRQTEFIVTEAIRPYADAMYHLRNEFGYEREL